VFVLHHYVGLPLVEVAELLEIPAGTARSRLHYAIEGLRRALTDPSEPALKEGRLA
jgi:RNA polymerase sigma-70 factor (ECF subfamily)